MGKNRDKAKALFDAFEKELTELAKPSGRDVKLTKSWRIDLIKGAKRRGRTVKEMIDEMRPGYIEAVKQANQVDTTKMRPDGGSVPFSLWGPDVPTKH